MEEDFNPIRDLRSPEVDPFNVPVGQSTQEIEAIRLTLVVTREKTENLVKLLKRKGLLFKRDVEKIKELQRRLRKTIPRIPILRDDSITETETSMADSRSSRFDIRGFNRPQKPTGDPVPVDKPSFPFLDVVISAVLIYFGIRGTGGGGPIKNFFNRFGKNKTKTPTIGDKLAEELARRIKELQDKGKKVPERILKLQKDLNRFLKNEKIANSMKGNTNAKIANNILKENRAFIKAEKLTISDSLAFTKRMVQEDLLTNPINAFENLQVARSTFTSRIEGLENVIQLGGLPKSRVKAIREVIKELKKANKEIDDISQKIADDLPKLLEEFEAKEEFFNKLSGSSKLTKEQIKQLYKMLEVKPPGKASIDGKSMSNDIAMLNTDTRDRETIVILTDSIA